MQQKVRTLASPWCFSTNLPKGFYGANSMIWANTSLPAYIVGRSGTKPGSVPPKQFAVQSWTPQNAFFSFPIHWLRCL